MSNIPAPEPYTLAQWREYASRHPDGALLTWSALEPHLQEEAHEEILDAWKRAIEQNGEVVLSRFYSLPYDLKVRLGQERFRDALFTLDEKQPGRAYPTWKSLHPADRDRICVADRARLWLTYAEAHPFAALLEHRFSLGEEAQALIPPERLLHIFRAACRLEPAGLGYYSQLPAEVQRGIDPTDLVLVWLRYAENHPSRALLLLHTLPAEAQARISDDKVGQVWSSYSNRQEIANALAVLQQMDASVRARLSDGDVLDFWSRLIQREGFAEALEKLKERIPQDVARRIPPVSLAFSWREHAYRGSADSLPLLSSLPRRGRNAIPAEHFQHAWQRRFRQNPERTMEETATLPEDMRRHVTRDVLLPLLSSEKAPLRLAAIAAVGRMDELLAGEQAPPSRTRGRKK